MLLLQCSCTRMLLLQCSCTHYDNPTTTHRLHRLFDTIQFAELECLHDPYLSIYPGVLAPLFRLLIPLCPPAPNLQASVSWCTRVCLDCCESCLYLPIHLVQCAEPISSSHRDHLRHKPHCKRGRPPARVRANPYKMLRIHGEGDCRDSHLLREKEHVIQDGVDCQFAGDHRDELDHTIFRNSAHLLVLVAGDFECVVRGVRCRTDQ